MEEEIVQQFLGSSKDLGILTTCVWKDGVFRLHLTPPPENWRVRFNYAVLNGVVVGVVVESRGN